LLGTGGLSERVAGELIEVEEIEQGGGKKVSQLQQMLPLARCIRAGLFEELRILVRSDERN